MISEKLDIFLEVGQKLNFSDVAKKRYTTQPTISRQISDLEDQWGVQLFVRSNKGLRLTPEGAIMLDCCRRLDQQLEEGLNKARNFSSSVREKLRLGILTDINAERLLMGKIHSFARDNNDLDITVTYGSFGVLREGLKKGKLDIIFTYGFELVNIKEAVITEEISPSHPCLAISPMHPLFSKEELKASDLSGEVFFLPEEADSPGREHDLLHILNANKIDGIKIRFAPNQESVLLQVRLGRGIMMIDADSEQVERYDLRIIPLEKFGHFGPNCIIAVWAKDNLNPFLSLFMQEIMK